MTFKKVSTKRTQNDLGTHSDFHLVAVLCNGVCHKKSQVLGVLNTLLDWLKIEVINKRSKDQSHFHQSKVTANTISRSFLEMNASINALYQRHSFSSYFNDSLLTLWRMGRRHPCQREYPNLRASAQV